MLQQPKHSFFLVFQAVVAGIILAGGLVEFSRADGSGSINATLRPGQDVGVGFDLLPDTTATATVTLKRPDPDKDPGWYIVTDTDCKTSSVVTDKSGTTIWKRQSGANEEQHVWKGYGFDENNPHNIVQSRTFARFEGLLFRKEGQGGQGGGPTLFQASVADLDLRVDSRNPPRHSGDHWEPYADTSSEGIEEDLAEATDTGGLYLPCLYPHSDFPSTVTSTSNDPSWKVLKVDLKPSWGGGSAPSGVGKLTFVISSPGVAIYRFPQGGGTSNWRITSSSSETECTISNVPTTGISEEFAILTNENFTSSGGITATFTWDLALSDSDKTARDDVRLAPIVVHYVRETQPASGDFVVIDPYGLPTYIPTDGVGAGDVPLSMYASGHTRFNLTLTQDLSTTQIDVVHVSVENATGTFEGDLTETSVNSGVFSNTNNAFTMTVTPVVTSNTTHDTLSATVTCAALGLTDAPFSLVEGSSSTVDSLDFCLAGAHAGVTLSGPLDPATADTIIVELDTTLDGPSVTEVLTETGVDSKVFTSADGRITATITNYTGLNPATVDSFTVSVSNTIFSIPTFTLNVNETAVNSLEFSSYADASGDGKPIINITPLTPATSDEGVFYVEVTASPNWDSVDVQLASTIDTKTVTANHVLGNLFRTGKIVLVEEGSNPTYSGITTLLCAHSLPGILTATAMGATATTPPKKDAFVGRAVSTTVVGGNHLGNVETTLINALGWTVTKNETLTRAVMITECPNHDLWYSFQHGITVDGTANTAFKKIAVWKGWGNDPVGSPSMEAYVGVKQYDLVFLNGCCTASTVAGSETTAFADAFNATAYVGWTTMDFAGSDAAAGGIFFQKLDNMKTVQQAVVATQTTAPEYAGLRVARGGAAVIDLTP